MKIIELTKNIIQNMIVLASPVFHLFSKKAKRTDDILIVSCQGLGDILMFLGYVQEINKQFPERKVSLLCASRFESFAKEMKCFSNVYSWNESKKGFNKFKQIKQIYRICSNTLICPFSNPSKTDMLLCTLINSKNKINVLSRVLWYGKREISWRKKIFNNLFDLSDTDNTVHADYKECFSKALNSDFGYCFADFSNFKKAIVDEKYFVIAPGSSSAIKNWPVDRFAEAAEYIFNKTGWTCAICGGKSELKDAELFKSLYHHKTIDFIGKLSVIESATMVSDSELLLCNDTSVLHMGAAAGVKTVVIPWGIDWGRFLPYPPHNNGINNVYPIVNVTDCFGCRNRGEFPLNLQAECAECLKRRTTLPCVNSVTVDQVIKTIDNCLSL